MIVVREAQEAWCPPTFSPSSLGRMWLALWIVQAASQRILRSSSPSMSRSGAGAGGAEDDAAWETALDADAMVDDRLYMIRGPLG